MNVRPNESFDVPDSPDTPWPQKPSSQVMSRRGIRADGLAFGSAVVGAKPRIAQITADAATASPPLHSSNPAPPAPLRGCKAQVLSSTCNPARRPDKRSLLP